MCIYILHLVVHFYVIYKKRCLILTSNPIKSGQIFVFLMRIILPVDHSQLSITLLTQNVSVKMNCSANSSHS